MIKAGHATVTQKDIAKRLGISRQLVGFALNGNPAVSEETRKKIQRAAEKLGYDLYSNRDARALIAKRYGQRAATGVVAAMLPPAGDAPLRSMPYFAPFLDGLEAESQRRGLDLLLSSTRNGQLPRMIAQQGVDGVVCVASEAKLVRQIQALDVPVVNLGRHAPGAHYISADDKPGTRLAVAHLIELGHRNIAYLGAECTSRETEERLAEYRAELQRLGLAVNENIVEATVADQVIEAGYLAFDRLLNRNAGYKAAGRPDFTAVVCYNDILAMGAARRASVAGLQIPRDLSITGFDDISLQYAFQPTLTSIAFPRRRMGERAVELLCELTREKKPEIRRELFPVTLVVRESTAAPKGGS